jgi:hypothetical protein
MEPELHITSLEVLFSYLDNATLCIPEEHRVRVFKDMGFKLNEWASVPISSIRYELLKYDILFNYPCMQCGNDIVDGADDQQFCSFACKVEECGCKADPTCCGRD